jgi:hypothetical protein
MKQPGLDRIILSFQKLVGIVPVSGGIDERETGIDHVAKTAGNSFGEHADIDRNSSSAGKNLSGL